MSGTTAVSNTSARLKNLVREWTESHGLLVPNEELIVRLVHRRKVIHRGDEHVYLDDVVQAASGLLEDRLEVLEGLSL